MTGKKMSILALCFTLALLVLLGGITAFIDPLFHYHGPWEWQEYPLYNERYQNDGIARHFEYDALITGTSMTENFKASEFDALFGVQSIKVAFSGASYKEANDFLTRAISYNPDLKTVIRGLDSDYLMSDKDLMRYDSYPDYLYDNNIFNDVNYLFNKDIFVNDTCYAIEYDSWDQPSTSFDKYANWQTGRSFGKEAIMATYNRKEKSGDTEFTDAHRESVQATFEQNVLELVRANPQIDFYLFFTPYSIFYFDDLNQRGTLQRNLEAQRVAIEMMLPYDNLHLFSFFDEFDVICNLDNYKDIAHYSQDINSWMLQKMAKGEKQLTKDNYQEYLKKINDFYTNYPYDSLFA